LHAGFICFLLDVSPKTKIPAELSLEDVYVEQIQKHVRTEKSIVDNVKKSINSNIYTVNQMGYFLATLLINQDTNIAPH